MPKSSATRDRFDRTAATERTNTVTPRRLDELQPELQGQSFADLMARHTLRVGRVVDAAADIAKEMALMHHRGLTYGRLESRNVGISGGRASLAPLEPAVDGRAVDDVRDFGVWLRGLVQALPEESGDKRRMALDEIAGRYLRPENLPASTQMKKAAMALALLRLTSRGIAAPGAAPPKSLRQGKVLLLVRVVSGVDGDETTDAKIEAPSRKAPWYAGAVVATGFVGALFYFMRGIL